jgi:D-alanine-D-alanine ligase-like ATP-grasp enzyme
LNTEESKEALKQKPRVIIQEQYELSTVRPSMLDMKNSKADAEANKLELQEKPKKARGFFDFISKMCSTSSSERDAEALTESIRPQKKQQVNPDTTRDTESSNL